MSDASELALAEVRRAMELMEKWSTPEWEMQFETARREAVAALMKDMENGSACTGPDELRWPWEW